MERIYVTEAVAPAFLPALVDRAGRITTGACTDPPLTLGPLVDDRQRSAIVVTR